MLPLVIGMLLNPRYGKYADRYKTPLKFFDQSIILIIIYTSFCKSFALNLFEDLSLTELLLLVAGLLGFFFVIILMTQTVTRLLKFNMEDTITLMFCGSKKSLVHGTVMSKVLFANSPAAGIVLLPLTALPPYSSSPLSVMAQRMEKRPQ